MPENIKKVTRCQLLKVYGLEQIKYSLPERRLYLVGLHYHLIQRKVYHELDSSPHVSHQEGKPIIPEHHVVGIH